MKIAIRIVALSIFTCAIMWGQGTAQIHGTIQDATGAAVPGAEVKAIQTETGLTRTATTGAAGEYVLTPLPVGPYRIEVAKEGFTKAVQTGVVLQVNTDPAVDVALKVGAVTEQVSVEANAALVETRSSGIGEVVQNQRIVELPLNGRNVSDLIGLGGASVQTGASQTRWFSNLPVISIGGGVAAGGAGGSGLISTDYSLDGASHLSYLNGTTMPIAFPDAVQEFKAETSGQTAQRGASTSVSIVTKSGTNNYHGDVFEFIRNDGFGSAREYFSPIASTYKRNQFGGTFGGPIKKDKLFFFGGYQGTTIRQTTPANSIVPTAQVLAGNFGGGCFPTLKNGLINNVPGSSAVFTNNTVDPAQFNGPAVFIAKAYLNNLGGLPVGPCGQVNYQVPTHENDGQYTGKFDYQLSDKQSIFLRVLETKITYPAPLYGCSFNTTTMTLGGTCLSNNMLNSGGSGENELASSGAIGDTYVISPTVVNAARLAFNRTAATLHSAHLFTLCDAGVGQGSQGPSGYWCGGTPGQLAGGTVGSFAFGTGLGDGDFWNGQDFAFNDDVNWLKGSHQMTMGFSFLQGRVDEFNHFAPGGTNLSFSGSSTGSPYSDFLLGDLSQLLQGLPNAYSARQNMVGLYFTDTWRINTRLTFNFGIRWEPFLPQSVSNGQISNFNMARYLAGTKSTVFANAPPGFYFPGDPGFPDNSSANAQYLHFDPRAGIAWDPKGDGKTSIRASYAFGYAFLPGIAHEDEGGSNPWGGRVTLVSPVGGLLNPWNGANPYPYAVTPNVTFLPGGNYMYTNYNLPATTTYSWNLSAQRQIGTTWVASATYIGSRVQHLYINQPIDYAQNVGNVVASGCAATAINCTSTANTQARRVLSLQNGVINPNGAFVSVMDTWYPYGTQLYNGGLFSLQKRFSKGVSMSANYTLSHCIGYFQGFNSKPEETATNPYNPLGDRGNCDSDRRNIVNLTAVALAPKFANKAMSMIVSGWQLAGIYKYQSGSPFAVQDGTAVDGELSGLNHQRPNLVEPNNVYTGQTCGGCFFINKAAFAAQSIAAGTLGTVGNLGWNSVVTPPYWDLDLALSRDFRMRERYTLQVRADAFNLVNAFVPAFNGTNPAVQANTAQPTSLATPAEAALNNAQFGQILNAFPTRKIQFAMKLTF
jgi:hypothetical protein